MYLEATQIETIKLKFQSMETKSDLVELLNIVQSYLYIKNKPILIRSLNYYAIPALSLTNKYSTYVIYQKSGKERSIHVPHKGLKLIQQCLNLIFSTLFSPAKPVMGFTKGKNVVDNAQLHIGKHYLFHTDIKDFFDSIQLHRIKAVLKLEPFLLDKEKEPLAFLIANLCCVDGFLPQGAPTSPILSNIICQKLDKRLMGLAKRFGVAYSRYADDITFSAYKNEFKADFQTELKTIIEGQGFEMNQRKTRTEKGDYRQNVTGLTVNEKVNVSRQYIREIRSMLHNWEKSGLEVANEHFQKNSVPIHEKAKRHDFISVLQGRLAFMKLVRGENDLIYQKYNNIFVDLLQKSQKKKRGNSHIWRIAYFKMKEQKNKILEERNKLADENEEKKINSDKLLDNTKNHKPLDTSNFLQLFRNSKGLKFLTHKFDVAGETFNRENILNTAEQEFEKAIKKYKIPGLLNKHIRSFAFNKEAFWKRRNVIEWCEKNPKMHPYQNPTFIKMIDHFKDSIEIRAPRLEQLIKEQLENNLKDKYTDIQLIVKDLNKASFFTDVEKLKTGLSAIFSAMENKVKHLDKIEIGFTRYVEGTLVKREITILHYKSESDKAGEELLLRAEGGDFGNAKNAFTGICDWFIEGYCKQEFFTIKILRKEPTDEQLIILKDKPLGFKHILTFYS